MYEHEDQSCGDITCLFSTAERSDMQENKEITPNNEQKCRDETNSPFKLHKNCDQRLPLTPRVYRPDITTPSIINSNIDVHPGGGHWSPAISERLKNTVVVFDWDDTIFPSSYLALLDVDYETDVIPKCLQDRLFTLETHALELFNFVTSLVGKSRVCIITNAEKGWVTLSGQKFMPRLLQQVCQCNIISARSTFEPFAPSIGPFEWKLLAFHMAAEVMFGSRFPKPSVHVMTPRQVFLPHEEEKAFVRNTELFDGNSNTLSDDFNRGSVASIDHDSGFEGSTDTKDNRIVQFSERCLNSGDVGLSTQSVHLSSTASGNHIHPFGTTSIAQDIDKSPLSKTEITYLPCDELVDFPEVPTDYLKHSGFDFVPAEDIEKVLQAQKFIVSLGDSLAEKIATQNIAGVIPNAVTKTLKYIDRPNLDQLIKETMLVRNHIQEYLQISKAVDILINIPEHDMTSFEQQYRTEIADLQNELHIVSA